MPSRLSPLCTTCTAPWRTRTSRWVTPGMINSCPAQQVAVDEVVRLDDGVGANPVDAGDLEEALACLDNMRTTFAPGTAGETASPAPPASPASAGGW